jgi:glycosyltransferase involved in cell wall biosynthesis
VKVAYFSPFPPERTGIAEYSALLLPALERRIDVVAVERGRTNPPKDTDVCLYHIGNNPDAHDWIVEALRDRPGVVVLHDFVLHHLVAGLTLGRGDGQGYLGAMEREAGAVGRLLAHGVIDGVVAPLWEIRPEDFPLATLVLEHAAKPGGGLIVHSSYVEVRARASGYDGRIWRIPHPAWPQPEVAPVPHAGNPLIGCFGNINTSKRIPQLLEAFAHVRSRHSEARLLLVGQDAPGFALTRKLQELAIDGVEWRGYVDEEMLWSSMAACDVIVSLRSPTMGETSGSTIRALGLGKPTIVSDVGWFAELPDEVALKIPADAREIENLATVLELLASSEAARQSMHVAALEYVRREHDLERVADAYAGALEEAAGGEHVEASVLNDLARAAAEVGIEPQGIEERELIRQVTDARLVG